MSLFLIFANFIYSPILEFLDLLVFAKSSRRIFILYELFFSRKLLFLGSVIMTHILTKMYLKRNI